MNGTKRIKSQSGASGSGLNVIGSSNILTYFISNSDVIRDHSKMTSRIKGLGKGFNFFNVAMGGSHIVTSYMKGGKGSKKGKFV